MGYYLEDNPPVRSQYAERPTGTQPRLIVVHTTEQPPDVSGADSGAEGLARYVQHRRGAGCYHSCVDSDSTVRLVSPTMQCWGARYVNPYALHISHSTKAALWTSMPGNWVSNTLARSAQEVAMWCDIYDIPPRLITRSEGIDNGVPGIISHAAVDPSRRVDPGPDFPWDRWLNMVADFMEPDYGPEGKTFPQYDPAIEDLVPKVASCAAPGGGVWLLTSEGGVFAWDAPYYGALNYDPRFSDPANPPYEVLGSPARILPRGSSNSDGYRIVTTLGYSYDYH
jgi:hypothetical protein